MTCFLSSAIPFMMIKSHIDSRGKADVGSINSNFFLTYSRYNILFGLSDKSLELTCWL